MKSDEGIFKMLSKSSIIRNQYENVIILIQNSTQKGEFLLAFLLSVLKIFNKLFNELSMKYLKYYKIMRILIINKKNLFIYVFFLFYNFSKYEIIKKKELNEKIYQNTCNNIFYNKY